MRLAWGTVTLPELMWTLIGIVGLRFKIPNVIAARKTIQAVNALNGRNLLGHDDMMLLALARLRRESLRIVMSLVIVGVGVGLMASDPTERQSYHISIGAVLVTLAFFLIESIDVLQSALDKKVSDVLVQERKEKE